MALTKVVYAPGTQVQSANLVEIQDAIIALEDTNTYAPTLAAIAPADISIRKGAYSLRDGIVPWVEVLVQLAWNNTNAGIAGTDVQIGLPYEAADQTSTTAPNIYTGRVDTVYSLWANSGTDRTLQSYLLLTADASVFRIQRVTATHGSAGFLPLDTGVARQVIAYIRYPSTGSLLV